MHIVTEMSLFEKDVGGILRRQYIHQVEISSGENAESNSVTKMGRVHHFDNFCVAL